MLIRENIETYKEESKHHHPMAHTAKGKAAGSHGGAHILGSYLCSASGTGTQILCDSVSSSVRW